MIEKKKVIRIKKADIVKPEQAIKIRDHFRTMQ